VHGWKFIINAFAYYTFLLFYGPSIIEALAMYKSFLRDERFDAEYHYIIV